MSKGNIAKRACQRCEYLNPREALYCLRCGDIFRPVLAETPWDYLRPELEQRKAEALGKAALSGLVGPEGAAPWLRLLFAALVLLGGGWGCFHWSVRRSLRRVIASEPAVVSRAIWEGHHPAAARSAKPLLRPEPLRATLADPIVATWVAIAGPLSMYLLILGIGGLARREIGPAHLVAPLDVFFPLGKCWSDLISGRRVRVSLSGLWGARLVGAPALLVAASYCLWGGGLLMAVPFGTYYAELQKEGWAKGLKGLGLDPPPASRLAPEGLWADADGTIRILMESSLSIQTALGYYRRRLAGWSVAPGDKARMLASRPGEGTLEVVALEPSPAQRQRGIASVLYLSLSGPEKTAAQ